MHATEVEISIRLRLCYGGQEGLGLIPRFLAADKRQKLALGFIPLIPRVLHNIHFVITSFSEAISKFSVINGIASSLTLLAMTGSATFYETITIYTLNKSGCCP